MTFPLDLRLPPTSLAPRMVICPECQQPNSPRARFCANCRYAFGSADPAVTEPMDADTGGAGQRPPEIETEVMPRPSSENRSQVRPAYPPISSAAPAPPTSPRESTLGSVRGNARSADHEPITSSTTREVCQLVQEAVADILDAGAAETPLGIEINFNRVLVAGHCSTAVARIKNQSAQLVLNTEVILNFTGLREEAKLFVKRLAPGQTITSMFEMEPTKSGNFIFRCTLRSDIGERRLSLRGTRCIAVNAAPYEGNIRVSVGDILANNDKNAGIASEVKISNLVDVSKIKSINDLLGMSLPDAFSPIPMEVDYEISVKGEQRREEITQTGLQIPKQFLGWVQAGTKLILEAKDGAMRDGGSVAGIHLVARDEFCIGRNRDESDYPAWFWPRSKANDERTATISRVHVKFVRRGEQLLMFDNASGYGASFEGQKLPFVPTENGFTSPAPQPPDMELSARGTLALGRDFQIDVCPLEAGMAGGPHIRNEHLWPGPPKRAIERAGSVRFLPLNTDLALHTTTWLITDATFGASRMNPLVIELPGLAEVAGRFIYYRDHFWIETLATDGSVAVNGYTLRPGELVPLVGDQELRLGSTEFCTAIETLQRPAAPAAR